jgi:hypothetical protein
MKRDTPINWLWAQLETLLSDPTLDLLRKNYDAQKHQYDLAAKIRQARRELATFERIITTAGPDTPKYQRYAAKIARRKARIALLECENTVIDDVS